MQIRKVIGIGNALTDFLVNLKNDNVLHALNLGKGSMNLVDAEFQRQIQGETADLPHTLSLGGSAGNTIRCMARLGAEVGYIGKVGRDSTGHFYEQALDNLGIKPFVAHGQNRSGRCLSLVSPDGERTMVTYLGAALELCEADITSGIDAKVKRYLKNFELVRAKMKDLEERDRVRNFQPPITGDIIMKCYALQPCNTIGEMKEIIKKK